MKFAELLTMLEKNQEQEVVFEFEHGQIRRDYHITEVLSTSIQAVDCGGAVDQWNETVLQLLEPRTEDGERFMEAKKALAILEKSGKMISLPMDGTLVLEFKPTDTMAAHRYHVSAINIREGKIFVKAQGAVTQCKALTRKSPAEAQASSCCGPKTKTEGAKTSACCAG